MTKALTSRQLRLLAALLEGNTVRNACAASNVPERTAFRWLSQDLFRNAYELRLKAISNATMAAIIEQSVAKISQVASSKRR